jgi:FtsZ-interacting cell division protein YlmF
MTLSDGLNGIISFIKKGFEGREEDIWTEFDEECTEEFAADGNAALDVMYSPKPESRWERKEESKVVSHPNYRTGEVTIMEPRSFGEAVQIVKKLKDKNTVVLNLHLLDKEQSQRTIDFVCGAAHALNGTPQKVGDMVFVFTPSNVALSVESAMVQNKFSESLWNKPL